MHKILLGVLVGVVSATAYGQAIYKHVDKDGKVTYSDQPPAKDAPKGSATKLEIDPERNRMAPPSAAAAGRVGRNTEEQLNQQDQLRAKVAEAKKQLEDAKKAQEAGKDPKEDEFVPRGAGRRGPGEAYEKRQADLQAAVKTAEENVTKAEDALRRGGRQ